MKLSQLAVGEKALVLALSELPPSSRKRLLDMGLTRGEEVTLVRKAPLGDPVWLALKGYELSFRLALAELIAVEKVNGEGEAQ
jgi:Fe2+ transport system protein FeoA